MNLLREDHEHSPSPCFVKCRQRYTLVSEPLTFLLDYHTE